MSGNDAINPITVTVSAAQKFSGLGRTSLYGLMSKQKIKSIRVGTRRLIIFESLKAFLSSSEG